MPPTIHPAGMPYAWITPDTLAEFDVADLPELPDDIVDRLAEALKPFGYAPPELTVGAIGNADLGVDSPHRALNDAALANLDAWVPALKLDGLVRAGGHYRAIASWRPSASGRPLAKRSANLSIAREGIKDFGDADKGYTPIDLVMAALGTDLETAFRWLQERVAPGAIAILAVSNPAPAAEPTPTPSSPAPKTAGNLAGLRLATFEGEPIADARLSIPEEAPVANLPAVIPSASTIPAADGVIPPELCAPPGLLGDVVNWITASARTPVPQHNLGAALALLGAIMGRRWEGPTRLRTNFYIMNVAGSGFGKEHPFDAGRELALAGYLDKFLGAEETKSDTALRKLLQEHATRVLFMDEFGGWMKKILARNAPAHDARTRDLLLTFFSRAKGDYLGTEGASEKAVRIANPNLNICGATTPGDVWKAFSSASSEDGLLPRFLVFDAGDKRPPINKRPLDVSDPPQELVRRLQALLDARPLGNLAQATNGKIQPIRAAWGEGAEEWFGELAEEMLAKGDADPERGPVYARVAEHTLKLALVLAVGIEAKRPVIDLPALEWARAIVDCSTVALLAGIDGRIADNDKQEEYLTVLRWIREAGAHGITRKELLRRVRGKFDERRFNDIIGQLVGAGEVWSDPARTGPNGGRPSHRIGALADTREAS
jgi:hypothetical protein